METALALLTGFLIGVFTIRIRNREVFERPQKRKVTTWYYNQPPSDIDKFVNSHILEYRFEIFNGHEIILN